MNRGIVPFNSSFSDFLHCCGQFHTTAAVYSPIQPLQKTRRRRRKMMMTRTTQPMSSYYLFWTDRLQSLRGNSCMSILYIMCMLIYFKRKEVYIQFSLLDVYLYCTFLCFIIYTVMLFSLRSIIISHYHSFPVSLLSPFLFIFNMKKYICPKRSSVIYLSCSTQVEILYKL